MATQNNNSAVNASLTAFETSVISYMANGEEYDDMLYRHIDDIQEATKIPMKQLRGVISSLVQKDVINVEYDFFRKGDTIVFYKEK